MDHIGGVKLSVLASNAIDRGVDSPSGQTKDYKMMFVASPIRTQQ